MKKVLFISLLLLLTGAAGADFGADLVTCLVAPQLPHIMIVSDTQNSDGVPLMIHNIGAGTREEDRLFEFEITGHYRPIVTGQNRATAKIDHDCP